MSALSKQKLFHHVGYEPHAGQMEVHQSGASRRVLACGVRWGKSTVAVHEALAALLTPGGPSLGWVVTPTLDTARLVMGQLLELMERHFSHRIVRADGRGLVVRNLAGELAEVYAKSASRPAALLGESLSWVVVDEAARMPDAIWREHVSQRLVDQQGWALLCSTPHGDTGWFKEEFDLAERGALGYEGWKRPTWENPAIERAAVEVERERLSPEEYWQEYGGEFVPADGWICPRCRWGENPDGRILTDEQWEKCVNCPTCGRPVDENGRPVGLLSLEGEVVVTVFGEATSLTPNSSACPREAPPSAEAYSAVQHHHD